MYDVVNVNVLLIIEMKNETSIAILSHLMFDNKLIEINVQINKQTRRIRRKYHEDDDDDDDNKNNDNNKLNLTILNYRFNFIFDNDTIENETTKRFVEHYLFFFFVHENLQRLINMMRQIIDF